MRPKSRLLRILLAVALVLLFAGYFAFSTFLFSPTEGDYEFDLATLVPRDVDFYVAKARLESDFDEFPTLKVAEEIRQTRAWLAFEGSGDWAKLERELGIEEGLARLDEIKANLHGVSLLSIFGGRDLAIAGYAKGGDAAQWDWAVYGRVNWIGKLGVELCKYPDVLGLSKQGVEVKQEGVQYVFSGIGIPRPIHMARIRDVVFAGTSAELVQKALDLESHTGQESFGQGADYFDHIHNAPRNPRRDEVELYVKWRDVQPALKLPQRWPDPESEDLITAFLGRVFQVSSIRLLSGVIGFDGGIQANLHGDLSSELITSVQERLYRRRGADRQMIVREAARMVRSDAALFAFLQVGPGELLAEVLAASEPALRANFEDLLRSSGEFKIGDDAPTHTERLERELDALFRDRVALIVRPSDYAEDREKDAPHDDTPVPAWAIALWTDGNEKSRQRLGELQKIVNQHQREFGIAGRDGDRGGVYTNNCPGGNEEIWEFWSQLIPGTGHISTAIAGDLFVVSNNFRMVCELLRTRNNNRNDPAYPRLSERPEFVALAADSLPQGNVMLWVDPKSLAEILRKRVDRDVRDQIESRIDWKSERGRVENEVMRQEFPGKMHSQLPPDEQTRFDEIVTGRLQVMKDKLLSEQMPAMRQRAERSLTYASSISAALFVLALDPKAFDLSLRAYIPLGADEKPAEQ